MDTILWLDHDNSLPGYLECSCQLSHEGGVGEDDDD